MIQTQSLSVVKNWVTEQEKLSKLTKHHSADTLILKVQFGQDGVGMVMRIILIDATKVVCMKRNVVKRFAISPSRFSLVG